MASKRFHYIVTTDALDGAFTEQGGNGFGTITQDIDHQTGDDVWFGENVLGFTLEHFGRRFYVPYSQIIRIEKIEEDE